MYKQLYISIKTTLHTYGTSAAKRAHTQWPIRQTQPHYKWGIARRSGHLRPKTNIATHQVRWDNCRHRVYLTVDHVMRQLRCSLD